MKYLTRVRNVNVESEQSEDSLTKRSYPDWALTKDRTRTGHSQKIVPRLETFSQVRNVSPDLSEVRVQHLTRLEMSSPDLSEVRVQHFTMLGMSSPDLSEVRVRPHKESGANWALTKDRARTRSVGRQLES